MNWSKHYAFLVQHQPMPEDPCGKVLEDYLMIVGQLAYHKNLDAKLLRLLVGSFAFWDNEAIGEAVQHVLRQADASTMIPILREGMQSVHGGVRYWSLDTARFFPSETYVEEVGWLLSEPNPVMRLLAAGMLQDLLSLKRDRVIQIARLRMRKEKDREVKYLLETLLER